MDCGFGLDCFGMFVVQHIVLHRKRFQLMQRCLNVLVSSVVWLGCRLGWYLLHGWGVLWFRVECLVVCRIVLLVWFLVWSVVEYCVYLVSLKFVGVRDRCLGWIHCWLGCWVVMVLWCLSWIVCLHHLFVLGVVLCEWWGWWRWWLVSWQLHWWCLCCEVFLVIVVFQGCWGLVVAAVWL